MEIQQKPQNLERVLSLLDATMINAGGIIGSGIFMVPATVAFFTGSTSLFFLVWILGGIISLFGALSVASFPEPTRCSCRSSQRNRCIWCCYPGSGAI